MSALFALGLAAAATAFMVGAFHGAPLHEPRGDPIQASLTSAGAGSIYYRAESNDGASLIGSVASDGTNNHIVFAPGAPTRFAQLAFSPDGSRVAYVDDRPEHRGIYVADADWGKAAQLSLGANDSWPSWSPDGSMLTFASTAFDPSIEFCHPGVYADCSTAIYVMGSDGSDPRRITNQPEDASNPVWSPDGLRLAFFALADAGIPTAIFVVNADGTGRVRLTTSRGGSDMWPSWSPTGDTVVFGGIHWEDWGVFAVNADGTDERTLLDGGPTYAAHPTWSPDGTRIAFGGEVADAWGIYVMNPDGSSPTRIAGTLDRFFVQEIAWRPTPALESTASVIGTFDVGLQGQASGITYGFGSMWVDGFQSPTGLGKVIRLDPETGEEQANISVGSVAPGWEVGGGGIAVGVRSVWVVGTEQIPGESPGVSDGVDTVLVRIDPSTNRVIDRIVLGGKLAADIAIDANDVWVLYGGDDDKMKVARVDPATDRVVATIPLHQSYGHYLFSVDGSIVAFTNETTDTIGNSVIEIVDPSTNTVTGSISLGAYLWPGAGDGSLWASTGTILERIDPGSGDVVGTWSLESTGDALCVGAGGIWSIDPNGRNTVSRWNPELQGVDVFAELPPGEMANAMTSFSDAVWVLSFGGSVTRIQVTV